MLLDIGTGILAAMFLSHVFGIPLSWTFILWGIIFNLLPDIDFFIHFLKGGNWKNGYHHRNYFHLPIIYILLGAIAISFIYKWSWSALFALTAFLHFIHDSFGPTLGVQWFWPFKKDHYALLYVYTPKHKEKLPKKILYVWRHEEIDRLAFKHADEDWVRNIYFKLHPFAIFEFLIFVCSLFFLLTNPPA
jgi:hypothetical protein